MTILLNKKDLYSKIDRIIINNIYPYSCRRSSLTNDFFSVLSKTHNNVLFDSTTFLKTFVNIKAILEQKDSFSKGTLLEALFSKIDFLKDVLADKVKDSEGADNLFVEKFYSSNVELLYSLFFIEYFLHKYEYSYSSVSKDDKIILLSMLSSFSFEDLTAAFYNDFGTINLISSMNLSIDEYKAENEIAVIQSIKNSYGKHLFENVKDIIDQILGSNLRYSEFQILVDYTLNNVDPNSSDWDFIYNKLVAFNTRHQYAKSTKSLIWQYTMLGKKSKVSLEQVISNCNNLGLSRIAVFSAFIKLGYADKKFIRKMRSESSSEVSLSAAKTLVECSYLYTDYRDLVAQFNDSKYFDVVNYLIKNISKDMLLGFIGNTLADKNFIFYRINGEDEKNE